MSSEFCYTRLQKEVRLLKTRHSDATASIKQVAYQIRESVKQNCVTQEWPPDSSRLNIDHIIVPPEISTFLQHLSSGDDSGLNDRMTCLANSIAQDIMFGVTGGRYKPIKHILLPTAVKSLTGNAELVQILNHLGQSISYSQLEEIDTSLCLQKLAMTPQGEVSLPSNIHQ